MKKKKNWGERESEREREREREKEIDGDAFHYYTRTHTHTHTSFSFPTNKGGDAKWKLGRNIFHLLFHKAGGRADISELSWNFFFKKKRGALLVGFFFFIPYSFLVLLQHRHFSHPAPRRLREKKEKDNFLDAADAWGGGVGGGGKGSQPPPQTQSLLFC